MKRLAILCAALAVAACGSSKTDQSNGETTLTIKGPDGQAVVKAGNNTDIELPAGFTLYPGATVVSNVTLKGADGNQSTLAMTTTDSLDKVVAFYKQQAAAAGVELGAELKSSDSAMIGGNGKDGLTFGLIAGKSDTGGTTANLSLQVK